MYIFRLNQFDISEIFWKLIVIHTLNLPINFTFVNKILLKIQSFLKFFIPAAFKESFSERLLRTRLLKQLVMSAKLFPTAHIIRITQIKHQ